MSMAFISHIYIPSAFKKLIDEYAVLAPIKKNENAFLEVLQETNLDQLHLNSSRLNFPFKSWFFLPKEKMLEYHLDKKTMDVKGAVEEMRETILIGLKECDVKAIELLDKVFLDDVKDVYYENKRKNTILITADCTEALESCFCTMMDLKPYPEKGYDLNLSAVEGGFLIECGSEKGKEILESINEFVEEPTKQQLKEREKNRKKIYKKLSRKYKFRDDLETIVSSGTEEFWEELSEKCVECLGCTYICPTCHCFYVSENDWRRIRTWDSCLSEAFQKVAGGANPRARLALRLKQRFYDKFVFFKEKYGEYACSGCGRCIEVCPSGIDITEVLKELDAKKGGK